MLKRTIKARNRVTGQIIISETDRDCGANRHTLNELTDDEILNMPVVGLVKCCKGVYVDGHGAVYDELPLTLSDVLI